MATDNITPRIYVASLSDYNAGRLHGTWISLDGKDASDIQDEVNAMLSSSKEPGAEEWAIHDYEGFQGVKIEEYESFENVANIAEALEDKGEAFALWLANCSTLDEALESFEDAYCGEHDSLKDYAEELAEEMGWYDALDKAGINRSYFDADSFANDLKCEGYWEENGHVFRPV